MYFEEKPMVKAQKEKDEEKKFPTLEGIMPEIKELLYCMEQDAVMGHEKNQSLHLKRAVKQYFVCPFFEPCDQCNHFSIHFASSNSNFDATQ